MLKRALSIEFLSRINCDGQAHAFVLGTKSSKHRSEHADGEGGIVSSSVGKSFIERTGAPYQGDPHFDDGGVRSVPSVSDTPHDITVVLSIGLELRRQSVHPLVTSRGLK